MLSVRGRRGTGGALADVEEAESSRCETSPPPSLAALAPAEGAAADEDEGKAKDQGKDEARIKDLAEKIRDYILDHQDDVAKEERWRTTLKRDMA